jgi:hypothetical protein
MNEPLPGPAGVRRHVVPLLFLASLALIGAIGLRGVHLRMHKNVHVRLPAYALPAAISMKFHHGAPYVSYAEVQDRLLGSFASRIDYADVQGPKGQALAARNNELLRQVAATPPQAPEKTRLFPGDDKGMVDVVLLALVLFGPTVQGVYYTTVLILLLTVVVFFVAFRDCPGSCVVPPLVLGGLYAAMPSLLLTQELYSFTNPRVFEFLGLIPLAHLALTALGRASFSRTRLAAAALQVFVIVECAHVRISATWLIVTAVVLYLGLLAVRFIGGGARRWSADSGFRAGLRNGWVVLLLLAGMGGLKAYQRLVYDPGYRKSHLQHRIVWHNAGMGLGIHPELRRLYGLAIDDDSMVALVKKRVTDRQDTARYEAIWGKPGDVYSDIALNFRGYEEEARALVLGIVREHPRAAVELFVYYKPLLAGRTLAWAAGLYPCDVDALHLYTQTVCLPPPEVVGERRLHVRFMDLLWIGVGLVVVCVWGRIPARALAGNCGLLLALFLGSFLPAAGSYPVLHVVGVPILISAGLLLGVMVTLLTAAVRFLADRARRDKPAGSPETGSTPP